MIYENKKDIDRKKIGGKAFNLRHLNQIKELNIPKWICLTTDLFWHVLGNKKKEYKNLLKNYSKQNREKIVNIINTIEFEDELKKEILSKLKNYKSLAVRSSAIDEDGREHSFAGMLDSFLDIKKEDVFTYIKQCYISCFSQRVMEYREQNNLINENIAVSVILMEYVDADYAGVMFTSDIKTNNPDEIQISVVKGIGENLVSGKLNSTDYTLNIFNEIVASNIEGCELSQKTLGQLADAGRLIENSYKKRIAQDIEFAVKDDKIYILQCRPITNYSHIDKNLERTILDNSNIIESYSGVTTPLTYTFAKEVYSKVYHQTLRSFFVSETAINSIEEDLNNMLYFYQNKIYYKLNSWYKMTALYPGYEKNKKYMENMMGVKTPLEETKTQAKTRLIKIYSKFIYTLLRMPKDSKRFLEKFNSVTKTYTNNKFEGKTNKELIDIYNKLESQIIDDFTTPIANDMGAMVFYGILSEQVKKSAIENGEGKISKILSKQGNVESVRQTTELIQIVENIKNDKKMLSLFKTKTSKELIELLNNDEMIFVKIRNYLSEFGARSMEELKLETITMYDNPEFLFNTIKEYLEIKTLSFNHKEEINDSILIDEFSGIKQQIIKK